jgi:hypothetical protein
MNIFLFQSYNFNVYLDQILASPSLHPNIDSWIQDLRLSHVPRPLAFSLFYN